MDGKLKIHDFFYSSIIKVPPGGSWPKHKWNLPAASPNVFFLVACELLSGERFLFPVEKAKREGLVGRVGKRPHQLQRIGSFRS